MRERALATAGPVEEPWGCGLEGVGDGGGMGGCYHVAGLGTSAGEDEDCFGAAASFAVFELAARVGAELAG